MRLENKLLLSLLPPIVICVLIITFIFYLSAYASLKSDVAHSLTGHSKITGLQIQHALQKYNWIINQLSEKTDIITFFNSEDANSNSLNGSINAWITKYLFKNPEIIGIQLLNKDNQNYILQNMEQSKKIPYLFNIEDLKGNISDTNIPQKINHEILATTERGIAANIYQLAEFNQAFIILFTDLDKSINLSRTSGTIEHPLFIIFDKKREILATNTDNINSWAKSTEKFDALLIAGEKNDVSSVMVGEQKFTAVATKHLFEINVVTFINHQLIENQSYQNLNFMLKSELFLILLILLLMIQLLRHFVSKPIELINVALNTFAYGDLSTPIKCLERKDEFGSLTNSLEIMRQNLNKSKNDKQINVNQDTLTGLPNRTSIMERLDIEIEQCQRTKNRKFALLFIDLDNFKGINDSMGHKVGDRLMVKVAQKLFESIRSYDQIAVNTTDDNIENNSQESTNYVARLFGDEFLIILNDICDSTNVARVAERIYELFLEPLYIDEIQVHISMSMGIVIYPENGGSPEELIKYAYMAMFSAKKSGKNQFRYYDNSMECSARKILELENELRKAISQNSFELFYQPQFDIKTNEIKGCEVLIRWCHREQGWISPAEFIPIAESAGLINELGMWIVRTVCKQIQIWQQKNWEIPTISINLSTQQIGTAGIGEKLIEIINNHHINPEKLEFEITETAVFNNKRVVIENITTLRNAGCKIALDDFGTGYSSLAWVQICDVDCIKIDRSFVTDVTENKKHFSVIASVIELSKQLNLKVVAEGIENHSEVVILKKMGCHLAQGYYYSKALPVSEFEKLYEEKQQLFQVSKQLISFP